jgi:hypothetical protein
MERLIAVVTNLKISGLIPFCVIKYFDLITVCLTSKTEDKLQFWISTFMYHIKIKYHKINKKNVLLTNNLDESIIHFTLQM